MAKSTYLFQQRKLTFSSDILFSLETIMLLGFESFILPSILFLSFSHNNRNNNYFGTGRT